MSLAGQGEPLRLADGRLVYPGGSRAGVERHTSVDTAVTTTRIRRKVSDLPADPRQMNAISAVLGYVLFGLDDEEIGTATGIAPEQVERIRKSDPYKQLHDAVSRSVLDSEADVVRELLAKNARRAAATMVEGLDAGSRGDRMAAARDILDRSGHRPADVVEHRHRMDGGLVIEIVKRDTVDVPTIDMGSV